jgi:hypothetical protein
MDAVASTQTLPRPQLQTDSARQHAATACLLPLLLLLLAALVMHPAAALPRLLLQQPGAAALWRCCFAPAQVSEVNPFQWQASRTT